MSDLRNDLDLKDACSILAIIITRTEQVRDAVERSGKLTGTDTTFLRLGAERELEALNIAMATMLIARGRIDEAGSALGVPTPVAPTSPPKPVLPATFRPARTQSIVPEISF